MKTKKVLLGSLLAVVILMIVPSIPAVEVNHVIETRRSILLKELHNRINDLDDEEQQLILGLLENRFEEFSWYPGMILEFLCFCLVFPMLILSYILIFLLGPLQE